MSSNRKNKSNKFRFESEEIIHVYPEEVIHGCAKPIRYVIQDNGCWKCVSHFLNTRIPNFPYIPIRRKSRSKQLHRYVWEKENHRYLRQGETLKSTCHNPACINPAHMKLGRTGHIGGLKRRSLTMRQARMIRKLRSQGQSVLRLAVRYNVSKSTVYKILSYCTYRSPDAQPEVMA